MLSCEIRFRYDAAKSVNALTNLAFTNDRSPDRPKAEKLVYADRLHLPKYARRITGDKCLGLPFDSIPSVSLDIMESITTKG